MKHAETSSTEPGSPTPNEGGAQVAAGRFAEGLPPRYEESDPEIQLGRGGSAEVVVSRELRLTRAVALKRLLPNSASPSGECRLRREARVTGLLEHPGIVPIHDVDRDAQGRLFYTMKRVAGRTLREIIELLKPGNEGMTPEEVLERTEVSKEFGSLATRLELFLKVCDAVSFAHEHPLRVIHRDLKPENIMVGGYGEVLVMDWGLAKVLGEGEVAESLREEFLESVVNEVNLREEAAELTRAGSFLGTPAYAPMEQLEGVWQDVDEKSDIYALGGVLYHLLTLDAPLEGALRETGGLAEEPVDKKAPDDISSQSRTVTDAGDRDQKVFESSGERVRRWCVDQIISGHTASKLRGSLKSAKEAGVPEALVSVILKALAAEPGKRMESVRDLARQIRLFQQGFAGDYERAGLWRHLSYFVKRHRSASLTATVALLVVFAISTGFTLRVRDQLVETQRQLERSQLEEGRAWLERARMAWEGEKDPLKALMFAGRAIGFHGYGRRAEESPGFGDRYPSLLGAPMSDPANETARKEEEKTVRSFMEGILPSGLPLWSNPVRNGAGTLAFSPDGSRLASTEKEIVKMWDVASGRELATLKGHSVDVFLEVKSVAFSPDGSRLASGSGDKTVKIWDVASGKELATFMGHSGGVECVAFSPDGNSLASGSIDRTIILWDVATERRLAILRGHSERVRSVAFSPDGSRLASGSLDRTVVVWDLSGGKDLAPLQAKFYTIVPGDTPFMIARKFRITVWELMRANDIKELSDLTAGQILRIPEPKFSLLDDKGYTVIEGDTLTSIAQKCKIPRQELMEANNFHEGRQIYVGDVILIPEAKNHPPENWSTNNPEQTDSVTSAAFSPYVLPGHSGGVESVAFSPDGRRLASTDAETLKLWDVASGKELAILRGHSVGGNLVVSSVAFSPDGNRLASGSWDKTVKLWDVASGEELATIKGHSGGVNSVVFSPDGSRLASSDNETVMLWDVSSGRELATLQGHSYEVVRVAFSLDGTRLASADNKTVKLWDVASGRELATLDERFGRLTGMAFSPNGNRLAARIDADTVRMWDVANGKELSERPDFAIPSEESPISPDGQIQAVRSGKLIYLRPVAESLDLLAYERLAYFSLQGREIVWDNAAPPITEHFFPTMHLRPDCQEQLAVADLKPEQRLVLRIQLCARGNAWRPLPVLWREAQAASLDKNPEVRRAMLRYFAISARALAVEKIPAFPNEVWSLLASPLNVDDFSDTAFSLALAQALPPFLRAEAANENIATDVKLQVIAAAPLAWLEATTSHLFEKTETESANLIARRRDFLRMAVIRHPQSAPILRAAIGGLDDSVPLPERVAFEDLLLVLNDATATDITDAAYKAAKLSDDKRATTLLWKAEERFPDNPSVQLMAGWIHLNLGDAAAALRAFEVSHATLRPGESHDTFFLAGHSIAQWLNQLTDKAIATYQQLIEAGRSAEKPEDWADPKTITALDWTDAETAPLEAIRAATVAKHPELKSMTGNNAPPNHDDDAK